MTPTLQNIGRRVQQIVKLWEEITLLDAVKSYADAERLPTDLWSKLLDRLQGSMTISDVLPAMIAEREQALADLGLRTPGVQRGYEKYPVVERSTCTCHHLPAGSQHAYGCPALPKVGDLKCESTTLATGPRVPERPSTVVINEPWRQP